MYVTLGIDYVIPLYQVYLYQGALSFSKLGDYFFLLNILFFFKYLSVWGHISVVRQLNLEHKKTDFGSFCRGKQGPVKGECNQTKEGVNFVLGILAGEASCTLLPGIRSHIVNSLPCVPLRIKFF